MAKPKRGPLPQPTRQNLKKHAAVIHIGADLTLVERKLANVLLLNAYDNLTTVRLHTIPVQHLVAMLGWDDSGNVEYLQDALETLSSTPVKFNLLQDGKASWHTMALIAYGKIENGMCSYSYADFLAEQLYTPEVYATINIRVQRLFDSAYALALYENCLRFKNVGSTGWWPVDTYRRLVGATSKIYDEFKYLKRDAINKPVGEVNRVSDIRLDPEFRKSGRKVSEIRFIISEGPLSEQNALPAPADKDARPDIRESDLFKKLRSHGIGERLAIAWIRQDEARARATVEYVEAKAREKQVRRSMAGYIRTLFESEAEVGKTAFDARQEARMVAETEAKKREEAEKWRQSRAAADAVARARGVVQALSPEARLALAAEYRQGDGAGTSASWDEEKGDFRSPMERIPFNLWLQKKFLLALGDDEKTE